MATNADGSVEIVVDMNVSDAEKELARLKEKIIKTQNEVDLSLKKKDVLTERLENAKKQYNDLQKQLRGFSFSELDTNPEANQIATEMQELEKYVADTEKELEKVNSAIEKGNVAIEATKSRYGEVVQLVENLKSVEATDSEQALPEAEQRLLDIAESAKVADQYIVDLNQELLELKARQKELVKAGLGLGTEEYDQNVQRIAEINQELKEYQNSLIHIEEDNSPFENLSEDAKVANQEIVNLNQELSELKARQKELGEFGIGLGHEEFDRNAKRIAEINRKIGEYEKKITGVSAASQKASDYMSNFGARLKGILASAFVFNILSTGLQKFIGWAGKSIKTNDEARQAIARLKGALLTLAQPLIEVVIPAFTLLVNILARVITAIAQLVSALFGKTLKQSKDGAKAMYKEADAIKGVGAAADEAAGSLAGFDEINTISTENSKGAGGGGFSGDTIKPDFTGMIEGELSKIAALVGAALLAVGAILTFSGANIPLGIALMAAGAITLVSVIATDWDSIAEMLQGPIGRITALISVALLALGALLAFSGINIPLGIALMAAGAIGLITVIATNWTALETALQGPIGTVTTVVSTALLALGAVLAFSGVNLPLGLALLAAGAIGLTMVIAANWSIVEQTLKGPVGAVTVLVSAALLALGAVILFSGANIPLGLGLVVAGAVGLASTIAANWDTIKNSLQGPIGAITSLVSAALLVLGSVLLFTGANIPLGLGLLSIGAVGLVASIAANWDTIQSALQGPVGIITTIISSALLVLGAVLLFTGASIPLGLGFLSIGAVGLVTSISANWKTITSSTENTIQIITGIVSAALLVLGVVLLFTGAGIPLGLGLIAAGAIGLAATIVPNWNFILEAVQNAWSNLKSWWGTNAAKFFTLDYWADLGKGMIEGLLNGLKNAFNAVANWVNDKVSWIGNMFGGAARSSSSIKNSGPIKRESRMAIENMPKVSANNIPALARGAVIPPNREFMAVLGDQKRGYNLEAPEGLIRKIVREEAGGNGDYSALLEAILAAIKAGHIIMVDRRVLGQTVTQEQNRMTRQSGRSVVLT